MQKITGLIILLSSIISIGCASTDTKESVIEPVANQPTKSKAYNIASQTILTRPYKRGFETIDSPLKDFTKAEIEDTKTELTRNVGSASKFFGTLSILTGNLTGVIDVVGGTVASISTSNHTASIPRWIVAVDKKQFNSPLEAQKYIQKEIQKSAILTLNDFGYSSKIVDLPEHHTTRIDIERNGKSVPFGVFVPSDPTLKLTEYNTTLIDGKLKEAYTTGFDLDSRTSKLVITEPLPFIARISFKDENLNSAAYYKALTAKLPKGFYLYVPSFVDNYYDGNKYTDLSQVVPAIYTQGEQYEFIQGM